MRIFDWLITFDFFQEASAKLAVSISEKLCYLILNNHLPLLILYMAISLFFL